jgi:hypothetical protein
VEQSLFFSIFLPEKTKQGVDKESALRARLITFYVSMWSPGALRTTCAATQHPAHGNAEKTENANAEKKEKKV